MKNEFNVKKFKGTTVYTLESASSGGTSAGSIASGPVSKDSIIVQSRMGSTEPPKPRNFVAKNAKMGGAGAHKDKKKAEKQGDVKHKNKQFAEGSGGQQYAVTIDAIDHGVLSPITMTASSPAEAKQKAIASATASMAKRGYELQVRSAAVKSAQGVAEGLDTEELANEVYAEFERTYPNLARRADERTVHAAIMDVLNYGGDSNPSALAQDVARAVKQEMQQGVAEAEKKSQYEMMMRNGQVKKFIAKDDADAKRIAAGHGAKSVIRMKGNVPGDKIGEQGVAEAEKKSQYEMMMRNGQVKKFIAKDDADAKRIAAGHGAKSVIRMKGNVPGDKIGEQGVAEGAPELLKKEMPLHRHAEKLLAQNGVSKDDPDYHHHLGNTIKHLRQFGNIDLINKQGVAEAEQRMSRAAKGNEKYGKDGMKALAKAGRDGASEKKLDAIRDKHDNYNEEWSKKYKSSINCSHPKGFSQKAHCAGKKKHNESVSMEMTCPDCGMCKTHGNVKEGLRDPKDNPCWKGYHPVGTKKKGGATVPNCVPKEGVAEDHEIQMASSELQSIAKNAVNLLSLVRKYSEQDGLEAWQQSKITKAADYLNSVLQSISGEQTELEDHSNATGGWGQGSYNTYSSSNHGRGVAEAPEDRTSYQVAQILSNKGIKYDPARENELVNVIGMVLVKELGMSPKQATNLISYDEDFLSDTMSELKGMESAPDSYMEALMHKLSEKIPANAPVDAWVQDFQKADPNKYHQFKNKNPAKKAQMAVAASYAAKNPSKK